MKTRILALALWASVGAGMAYADAVASPAPTPESPKAQQGPSPAAAGQGAVSTQDEEYRVGANDLLEISVFQVKELDRAVRVNSRGLITLPLIGAINAAGLTATELEEKIAAKLKESYLQDPQVSVFIKEFTSQRVTLEGQVEKAGIYPITGRTTLLQTLALSGGIKELGETSVRVFRLDGKGTRQILAYDVEQIRGGQVTDPVIKNNDIIVVGKNEAKALFQTFLNTIRGFVTFGGAL